MKKLLLVLALLPTLSLASAQMTIYNNSDSTIITKVGTADRHQHLCLHNPQSTFNVTIDPHSSHTYSISWFKHCYFGRPSASLFMQVLSKDSTVKQYGYIYLDGDTDFMLKTKDIVKPSCSLNKGVCKWAEKHAVFTPELTTFEPSNHGLTNF